jgi:hypothetical protein
MQLDAPVSSSQFARLGVTGRYFYHATWTSLLPSIQEHGLLPGGSGLRNWEASENFVYLAGDPDVAESFCEITENEAIDEEELVSVLRIPVSAISATRLALDSQNPGGGTWQFSGVIPWSVIEVIESQSVS